MSKSLILLIAIFSLWCFISFTQGVNNKNEQKEGSKIADDDVKRVTNNTLINEVTA